MAFASPSLVSKCWTRAGQVHTDLSFQSRPVLCQTLRGNIKRSGWSDTFVCFSAALWEDNWGQPLQSCRICGAFLFQAFSEGVSVKHTSLSSSSPSLEALSHSSAKRGPGNKHRTDTWYLAPACWILCVLVGWTNLPQPQTHKHASCPFSASPLLCVTLFFLGRKNTFSSVWQELKESHLWRHGGKVRILSVKACCKKERTFLLSYLVFFSCFPLQISKNS